MLKSILQEYESYSGQCVNYEKSIVFFSTNTSKGDRSIVSRILRVRALANPERYLGLPNMVGRNKKKVFQLLKDKFRKQIES